MAEAPGAFGLTLSGSFELRGAGAPGDGRRPVRVDGADPGDHAELAAAPVAGSGGAVVVRRGAGAWLVAADGHGSAMVAADGSRVTCAAAADTAPHCLQALVAAQAMPLAATIQGLEVLHAAAVADAGSALAVVGPAQAGKSTTLAALLLAGAAPLADDALALEDCGSEVTAHPGVGVIGLRPPGLALLGAEAADFGEPLGEAGGSERIDVGAVSGAVPLATLVLLERGDGADGAAQPVGARELLGTTFMPYVRDRERLERHLSLAAAIARRARVVRLRVGPGTAPQAVAEQLLATHREAAA